MVRMALQCVLEEPLSVGRVEVTAMPTGRDWGGREEQEDSRAACAADALVSGEQKEPEEEAARSFEESFE